MLSKDILFEICLNLSSIDVFLIRRVSKLLYRIVEEEPFWRRYLQRTCINRKPSCAISDLIGSGPYYLWEEGTGNFPEENIPPLPNDLRTCKNIVMMQTLCRKWENQLNKLKRVDDRVITYMAKTRWKGNCITEIFREIYVHYFPGIAEHFHMTKSGLVQGWTSVGYILKTNNFDNDLSERFGNKDADHVIKGMKKMEGKLFERIEKIDGYGPAGHEEWYYGVTSEGYYCGIGML